MLQIKMSSKKVKLATGRPDAILESHSSAQLGGSGANDYYAYMLREEKLKKAVATGGGYIGADELKALGGISDLEKLELKCLARLSLLGDNSPELMSYLSITSTSTREECSKKLARKQYRKQLIESALTQLLPSSEASALIGGTTTATRSAVSQTNGFGLPSNFAVIGRAS
jgi:hypothetical protein